MCYAHLSTCRTCSWTLHIKYPLCPHAESHSLDPTTCPNRMKRRYDKGRNCVQCHAKKHSLSLHPSRIEADNEMAAEEMEEYHYHAEQRQSGMRRARNNSCVGVRSEQT
ncbi:hypothetical protein BDV95DRAFT_229752 [Massariosphaeria phaeospora]|uniref:Uncharacterized protein n=1 Tax=Massariosphaeria phaeospora TaxID=100035 RepID=A0A7C8MWD9_9PLEO|nr:hypothetical protein BDV95DRAFT_229752 [Massariosphaeria phaeospora]